MTFDPDRPTYCETCDNVYAATRKQNPSQWLCVKFPRLEGQGYVARQAWVEQQPYMRCVGINGGFCPLWAPVRNGQRDNGL